jgi:hypothetical protein
MVDDDRRVKSQRWEHGSDFDYPAMASATQVQQAHGVPAHWTGPTAYWHSGRDALRALVSLHPTRFARVYFPSFYCQDVPIALRNDGVEVHVYPDAPVEPVTLLDGLDLRTGDAVVVSNTLGLRGASPVRAPLPNGVTLVEDHSHDPFSPWARSSQAAFAFASLRKWVPIPDGGCVWSAQGLDVPQPPALDDAHAAITLRRLSGMLLKSSYLAGQAVDKASYRELLVTGEEQIAHGRPGAMSPVSRGLLSALPMATLRRRRLANFAQTRDLLHGIRGLEVLGPSGAHADQAVPFAVTLALDSAERRDALRSALAQERIYGAVLWPLDASLHSGVPAAHVTLSKQVLSIHCDHRYDALDMQRVSETVRRVLGDK